MYSTFYLFPGQTEANSKFEERGKTLVFSPEGWSKITKHLDKDKDTAQVIEQELERRKYLHDASYNMTKHWDNSIEKIQQRQLEERSKRIEAKEKEKYERFLLLRAEQKLEREEYVSKVKKRIYMVQERPRAINNAFLLSEVMHEHQMQKNFNQRRRYERKLADLELGQEFREAAEVERKENLEKERKRRARYEAVQEELRDQMRTKNENEQKEWSEENEAGIMDIKRAAEELKLIQEYEKELDRDKKAEVKRLFHEFADEQQEIRDQIKYDEQIEDKIISVYSKAKTRINAIRKQRDVQAREEKMKLVIKLGQKVLDDAAARKDKRDVVINKAVKEFEERDEQRRKADEEHVLTLRNDRLEMHKKYLEKKKHDEKVEIEKGKWDMVNRFKVKEVVDKHDLAREQRKFDKRIEYRKELFKQMAEKAEVREKASHCDDEELKYHRAKEEYNNSEFFKYADEVLHLAEQKGRSKYPILRVIEKYKVDHGLKTKKKDLSFITSNVPINKEDS